MRVLYIIHSCIMGGATISFKNLVQGIKAAGIEVTVVYPESQDCQIIDFLTKMGCKCISVKHIPCSIINEENGWRKIQLPLKVLRLIIYKILFFCKLIRIVSAEQPDLIHTNTGIIHEGYFVARKKHIPHIWHLREYQQKDFNWIPFPSMRIFKRQLRNSYSICITKDVQSFFGLKDFEKSFVIYNPTISEKDYISLENSLSVSTPFFLVANRLSPEKGVEEIISAFSNFLKYNNEYELKVCGFGADEYVEFLKQLCLDKGVDDSVKFLGYLDTFDIYRLMVNAKALIVASYSEGFGRMTAEANILGIPVIGRDSAGTREILEQTGGGFTFSTVEEIVHILKEISEMSKKQISDFMNQPMHIARSLFSTEQHVDKVIALYKSIMMIHFDATEKCPKM